MTEPRPQYIVNGREVSAEQSAREMLQRMGCDRIVGADVAELADLLALVDAFTAEDVARLRTEAETYAGGADWSDEDARQTAAYYALADRVEAILRLRGRA